MPCVAPYMPYPSYGTDFSKEDLDRALELVKEAVQDERSDELFYDYLISVATTQEEKDIIISIRNDERNHRKWYREIYKIFTGKNIENTEGESFTKPKSYIEGISKAVFGELSAMEKYRIIREGLPSRYYRDLVFQILTDEMKHATKYNYILTKNAMKYGNTIANPPKTGFTMEEAAAIAKMLGIDFSKSTFDLNQFWMGVNTELEHGNKYYPTNVTGNDPLTTGKIALAHLTEFPDYYTRLSKLEKEAKAYWKK